MPDAMVEMLRDKLSISNYDSMLAGRPLLTTLKTLSASPNVGKANLVNKPMPRLRHLWFDKFLQRLRRHPLNANVLLYYPYHTFEHVLELLRRASFDPSVLAIKINIYR